MLSKQKNLKNRQFTSLVQEAFEKERNMLKTLNDEEVYDYMVSKLNYCQRKKCFSGKDIQIYIQTGDVCYIDFGSAYLNEAGYLHFGIILSVVHGKAFVVPMTGNASTYKKALGKTNPEGKNHTMRLGLIDGLVKNSVLFLNDAKWINTARIIDTKAHIDPDSPLFKQIVSRVKNLIE